MAKVDMAGVIEGPEENQAHKDEVEAHDIGMACIIMAYTAMACIVMAYAVMTHTHIYIYMAYTVVVYIVMAEDARGSCN